MLIIDGSYGEGGGQIVRSALALSLCYNMSVKIINIRAKRRKPGLSWQLLAAVKASAKVGDTAVKGAHHGSQDLIFTPKNLHGVELHLDIGTAGSTILVLQTILPALLLADEPSTVTLTGGTHVPLAPSFDYLQRVFLPILSRMGAQVNAELIQPGFISKVEGQMRVKVNPVKKLKPLHIDRRGEIQNISATARVAGLPLHIAERELETIKKSLRVSEDALTIESLSSAYGPGNVVFVEIVSDEITELFTGYGEKHLRAEKVAQRIATEVKDYINADVPLGRHLADQLLIPFTLAGGGSFVTQQLSSHTLTNMEVIRQFTGVEFKVEQLSDRKFRVSIT